MSHALPHDYVIDEDRTLYQQAGFLGVARTYDLLTFEIANEHVQTHGHKVSC